MRVTRRVLINTIAFLVASAILFTILAYAILPTIFTRSYSIYGIFPEAGGVFTNQEITYRGVQVGRVGEMTLTSNAVKIEMIIEADHKIPASGTRARVLYKSAVGEQFIDLLPTTPKSPWFKDGDVIPLERTSIPVQSEDLLRELNAVLKSVDPRALGVLIHELGTGLRGHGKDLQQLLLSIDTLAALSARRAADIERGIDSGADLFQTINPTAHEFVSGAKSLEEIARTLAQRRNELADTLESTSVLDREILALLKSRRAEIERIVADAATTTRLTRNQLGDLELVLRYLGPFLSDVYSAYRAPYFLFNVVTNGPADSPHPPCAYASGNSERRVTETDSREPDGNFNCENPPGEPSYAK